VCVSDVAESYGDVVKKRRYSSEQSIIDELKMLTEQTRKLREELRDMVSDPKPQDLTRALLHTQSWAKGRRLPGTADRRRKKR
jgi:hypothetical protein